MAAAWGGPSRRTSKTFLASTVAARIVKISKPYVFNAMPERRTVESSFARLEKIRRLCKELRAAAPYLLAVHSYRIFGSAVQDTKRLWGTLAIFSKAFLSSAQLLRMTFFSTASMKMAATLMPACW